MRKYINQKTDTATDVGLLEAERIVMNKIGKLIKITKLDSSKIILLNCIEHFQLKEYSIDRENKEAIKRGEDEYCTIEDTILLTHSHFYVTAFNLIDINSNKELHFSDISKEHEKIISDIMEIIFEAFFEINKAIKTVAFGKD